MSTDSRASRPWPWLILLVLVLAGGFYVWAGERKDNHAASTCTDGDPTCTTVQQTAVKLIAPDPYRFVAFGDWGAGTQFQKDVAAQLVRTFEKTPYPTVLMLGDNIYERGEVNKYGDARFTQMYAPLIKAGVNFVVALGNHDVLFGHKQEQIKFFHMPGSYYSAVPPEKDIQFFIIDSNTFAGDQVQQQWLNRALTDSKASCKIVMGHHPIYTSGEHGFYRGLQKTLEPLMIKHHVTLYLSGHDHDYERFAPIQGIGHVVAGTGGAYLRDFPKIMKGSLVRRKVHGFVLFEYKDNALHMQAIDKTGAVYDTAVWPIPQPVKLPKAS